MSMSTSNNPPTASFGAPCGSSTASPPSSPLSSISRPTSAPAPTPESTIEFRASPQPDAHGVWSDLQVAIDDIHAEQRNQRLAPLARFPHGEWRTTPANGVQQRDVWTWGPAKHALTSITSNSQATTDAIFGRFRVIYHHPQRDELTVLALSGPDLIQTGTLTRLEGLDLRFDMILFYDQEHIAWATEPRRAISSVWTFDTPTSYTSHWIEDQGQPVDPSVTAWAYTRHDDVTPLPPSAAEPPEHITHLNGFLPFLETEWMTDATRTSLAWIPYNEAILMRTIDTRTNEARHRDDLLSSSAHRDHPHPHHPRVRSCRRRNCQRRRRSDPDPRGARRRRRHDAHRTTHRAPRRRGHATSDVVDQRRRAHPHCRCDISGGNRLIIGSEGIVAAAAIGRNRGGRRLESRRPCANVRSVDQLIS
jgi:hypothetical protein